MDKNLLSLSVTNSYDKQKTTDDIDYIINKYRKSDATLAEIFGVVSEFYRNVDISKIGLSVRVENALKRCWERHDKTLTLHDLLIHTLGEYEHIRNLGVSGLKDAMNVIKKYLTNHQGRYVSDNPAYGEGLNIYRLARTLKRLMKNEGIDDIDFRESELPYVDKYKEAIGTIDDFLCKKAYMGDEKVNNIMNMLCMYAIPIYNRYESKLRIERVYFNLSPTIWYKQARPFIQAYYLDKERARCNFLLNIQESKTLNDVLFIIRNMDNIPYSLANNLVDFFTWLNFDIDYIANSILSPITIPMRDVMVFKRRANKIGIRKIKTEFMITKDGVYAAEKSVLKDFRHKYKSQSYDYLAMIYALKDNKDHVVFFRDIIQHLGEDNGRILWYAIKKQGNVFNTDMYYYDKAIDAVVFC